MDITIGIKIFLAAALIMAGDSCNDQKACDWLVAETVTNLTGEKTPAAAWNAIFRHFNNGHGKESAGYRPGEKIAIKVNNNNTY